MFRAFERDLLLPIAAKVGKNARRNLRFLHFRARYGAYRSKGAYHAFAGKFPFRFVKRIVSASAPLPLMPASDNALVSTVENVSGSGTKRKSMRHTKRQSPCSANTWYKMPLKSKAQRGRILKPQV